MRSETPPNERYDCQPGRDGGVLCTDLLGIRRIINDFRTSKKRCKIESKTVDTLTISGYGIPVMSAAQ